jgi:hypothetical protein
MDLPKRIKNSFSNLESLPVPDSLAEFNMEDFKFRVNSFKHAQNKQEKADCVSQLLNTKGLIKHYQSKVTNCVVLAVCEKFEYDHELQTSMKLADEQYNVLLVPNGYFSPHEKKFDVFLFRNQVIIASDLKRINSRKPDTIAARIKLGSEQSSRLVLDIASNIDKITLIDGLRSGCERNKLIVEIMLFYRGRFYRLRTGQILSKSIFQLIK